MHNFTNQLQSKNYLKELEGYMGIEISDEELLAMEPKLLLQLQEHLKDFRHKNQSIVSAPSQNNEFIYVSTEENEEPIPSPPKIPRKEFVEVEINEEIGDY